MMLEKLKSPLLPVCLFLLASLVLTTACSQVPPKKDHVSEAIQKTMEREPADESNDLNHSNPYNIGDNELGNWCASVTTSSGVMASGCARIEKDRISYHYATSRGTTLDWTGTIEAVSHTRRMIKWDKGTPNCDDETTAMYIYQLALPDREPNVIIVSDCVWTNAGIILTKSKYPN